MNFSKVIVNINDLWSLELIGCQIFSPNISSSSSTEDIKKILFLRTINTFISSPVFYDLSTYRTPQNIVMIVLTIYDNEINKPSVIMKGILNLPANTLDLRCWRLWPSNGRAPHTITYKTTPRLWNRLVEYMYMYMYMYITYVSYTPTHKTQTDRHRQTHTWSYIISFTHISACGPEYSFPSKSSGAA